MEQIIKLLKNFKKGPITTALGFLFIAFSGYMIYMTYEVKDLGIGSIEFILLIIGLILLVSPDVELEDE